MRLRFAPSPSGQLHVGNARTALFNWLLARGRGGRLILRIENTDAVRSTPASEASILEDLRWLGLSWDEGPDIGGPHGPYRQSERLDLYRDHARRLLTDGRAYYCFCSATQLDSERALARAAGRPPRYSGRCRRIVPEEARRRHGAGELAAVRFRVPEAADVAFDDLIRGRVAVSTEVIGDPILLRSDGSPAYNFAVVVDDALMRITHVVRGEDHISNTPRQVLMYDALGFEPPRFAHLSLVLGPDHAPLSKRHGATSVAEFRARGYLPEALVNYLALIGWSPGDGEEIMSSGEMAGRFSLEHVGRSAGVFDEEKLAWVNRHYLREADGDRLVGLIQPYLRRHAFVSEPAGPGMAFVRQLVSLVSGSVDRLDQVASRVAFVFAFDARASLIRPDVRAVVDASGARDVIVAFAEEVAAGPRLDRERFRAAAGRVRSRTGRKGRDLFHPIRVALTGEAGGPELDLAVPVIESGAGLGSGSGVAPVKGCRERAAEMASVLAES